jgi:hypothetical protein
LHPSTTNGSQQSGAHITNRAANKIQPAAEIFFFVPGGP